jgi:hypothetical protein
MAQTRRAYVKDITRCLYFVLKRGKAGCVCSKQEHGSGRDAQVGKVRLRIVPKNKLHDQQKSLEDTRIN